jgi:hypothetical protein
MRRADLLMKAHQDLPTAGATEFCRIIPTDLEMQRQVGDEENGDITVTPWQARLTVIAEDESGVQAEVGYALTPDEYRDLDLLVQRIVNRIAADVRAGRLPEPMVHNVGPDAAALGSRHRGCWSADGDGDG